MKNKIFITIVLTIITHVMNAQILSGTLWIAKKQTKLTS